MKKESAFKLLAAAISLAAITNTHAAIGTATAEVEVLSTPITIEEIQPYRMEMELLPGVEQPAGGFQLTEWAEYLAINPSDTAQGGCLRITGEPRGQIEFSIIAQSPLQGADGTQLLPPDSGAIYKIATSGIGCNEALAGAGNFVAINGSPQSAEFSATGEVFIGWSYRNPTSGSYAWTVDGPLEVGTYSGTVDLAIDYQ